MIVSSLLNYDFSWWLILPFNSMAPIPNLSLAQVQVRRSTKMGCGVLMSNMLHRNILKSSQCMDWGTPFLYFWTAISFWTSLASKEGKKRCEQSLEFGRRVCHSCLQLWLQVSLSHNSSVMIQFRSYVMVYSAQDSQGIYILASRVLSASVSKVFAGSSMLMNQNDTKSCTFDVDLRWVKCQNQRIHHLNLYKSSVFGSAHSTLGTERTSPWSDNHRIPKKH